MSASEERKLFEKMEEEMKKLKDDHSSHVVQLKAKDQEIKNRGDEWSLRAFASMRALRFFLRARAEIKNLLREQRALLIFSACSNP